MTVSQSIHTLLFCTIGLLFNPVLAQPEGFQRTDNKLAYKIIHDAGSERKAKVGEIITVKLRYRSVNDSVLFDSKDRGGFVKFRLKEPTYKGDINEGYALLGPGDSATFASSANQFYGRVLGKNRPKFIPNGSLLYFDVKMVKVESLEEVKKALAEQRQKVRAQEEERIKGYLEKQELTASPTESGLYVISRSKGAGAMAKKGDNVRVHYTGKFLDGKVFDSSHKRGSPLPFVLGSGKVIRAWDEAIEGMRAGDKITLIAPSHLAYGKKGYPGSVPPYTTLVFEMELISVR